MKSINKLYLALIALLFSCSNPQKIERCLIYDSGLVVFNDKEIKGLVETRIGDEELGFPERSCIFYFKNNVIISMLNEDKSKEIYQCEVMTQDDDKQISIKTNAIIPYGICNEGFFLPCTKNCKYSFIGNLVFQEEKKFIDIKIINKDITIKNANNQHVDVFIFDCILIDSNGRKFHKRLNEFVEIDNKYLTDL